MTRSSLSAAALGAVCALVAPAVLRADVAIGNLAKPAEGSFGLTFTEWQAQAFTTGPEHFDLTDFILSLSGFSDAADHFFVSVYSDGEAGTPQHRLAKLTPAAADIEGPGNYLFSVADTPIVLKPLTTYWIVAGIDDQPAAGSYSWAWTASLGADSGARPGWSVASDYAYGTLSGPGPRSWTREVFADSPYKFEVRGQTLSLPDGPTVQLASNTAFAVAGSAEVNASTSQAVSFTVGAAPLRLGRVDLPLLVTTENSTLHAAVFASAGGAPFGEPLAILPPVAGTNLGTGGTVSFAPATTVVLQPGIEYWLGLIVDMGPGEYRWLYTNEPSVAGSGVSIGYRYATTDPHGVWFAGPGTPFLIGLYGTVIPEFPACATVLGLVAFHRVLRRRGQSAAVRVRS